MGEAVQGVTVFEMLRLELRFLIDILFVKAFAIDSTNTTLNSLLMAVVGGQLRTVLNSLLAN